MHTKPERGLGETVCYIQMDQLDKAKPAMLACLDGPLVLRLKKKKKKPKYE